MLFTVSNWLNCVAIATELGLRVSVARSQTYYFVSLVC